MQLSKQILSVALGVLLLFCIADFAAADITNGKTIINNTLTGTVTGNSNSTDVTDLSNPNIVPRDDSAVYDNHVTIQNGGEALEAYGGITYGNGQVYNNTVTIDNDGVVLNVYGGRGAGVVSGNAVSIANGGKANFVYGGYASGAGAVTSNSVKIDGRVYVEVYGGLAYGSGNASDNTVSITGNGTAGDVFGGWASGDGDVIANSVIIEGEVDGAYGGRAANGNALRNSVEVSGTAKYVYGGSSHGTGDVANNTVQISGQATTVYGGLADATGAIIANVSNNTITITSDGTVMEVYGGMSYGDGDVTANSVIIRGKVSDDVHGAWASGDGNVSGNTVEISGNVDNNVYGGVAEGLGDITDNHVTISGSAYEVYGGMASAPSITIANVSKNTVSIASSGTVTAIYGGWATGDGDVTENHVKISGTVNGDVYGGFSAGNGAVKNNIVDITETATLSNATLKGSNILGTAGTGNTLNIYGFSGDVVEIANFENYNIELGQLGSDSTVINITGGTPLDIDDSNITISFTPEFVKNNLNVGNSIIVFNSITNSNPDSSSITIKSTPFIDYDFSIDTNNELVLTLNGMSLQPQTKALGEGFAAGLAFLGQAADVRSSFYFMPQGPRFIPFAKMVYGRQNISSGSSITVKGFSALAGLALNTNFDNGSQLVVGVFVEGGWGDYDSRNSFKNSASIKGRGDTEYYGGGVLARYALKSGLYGEGSFAAGRTETDFRSYDFTPGTRSKYDYSVPYYSTHVGLGQILNLTDMLNLDVYGKYLWTRQAGDNITVDGNRFKFKDADSHRVRVGGKLKADVSPQLQPYAGAAYEYEFSGQIKGSLHGMHMDKPSLRGGTGIGELGLVWTPNDAQNLRVDLGMQGYVGKREGISGGLSVSLSF